MDITGWSCDTFTQDNDGNWPLTGTYTFTAKLETGYALAPETEALEVLVTLGGATTYDLITGSGYSFNPADGKLTIDSNGGTYNQWKDGKIARDAILSVEVKDGVTKLIGNAFQRCVNLSSVTLPSSLTVIEGLVFDGCTSLTHIDLSDKLEKIMSGAFAESGLTSTTIPASVTNLFSIVFYACPDLETVIFKGSTAPKLEGGRSIFEGMASPPTVYVPDGVTGYDKLGVPVYPDGITPAIKTHPQSRTVTVGETASFTVATEKAVPFFQWQVSKSRLRSVRPPLTSA